jgi:iron complex outermembrane receptor protein
VKLSVAIRRALAVSTAVTLIPSLVLAQAAPAGLEEIVVTATKRVIDMQKAPAAITAIGADAITQAGIADIRAAQNLVPSVRFQAQNAATEIYMRGVGSTIDLPNIEPPTSLNFNGIYVPREVSAIPLFDMQSIEVLPGPQGTLYGRGSLGGVVNASFARPTDVNEGSLTAEIGNYNLYHVTAVGNLAASDTVALRGGIDYANADGVEKTGANSIDNLTARASLRWDVTDTVDVYLWGLYSKREGNSNNVVTVGVDPVTGAYTGPGKFLHDDPWNDTRTPAMLALPSNPNLPPPTAPRALPTDGKSVLIGAEVNIDLGFGTLTYIPSYMDADVDVEYFFGAYPTSKYDEAKQTTHELRLAGRAGRVDYLAGLYAYQLETAGTFLITGFPISIVDQNRLQGYAAFGSATISITDPFRVTVGGRFSTDDRKGHGPYTGFLGSDFVFNVPYDYDESFDHADYKLGVEYDMGQDAMLYAAIQTGYQPGTFNTYPSTPSATNKVKPAELTAYTAGIKSRWLDNRLQVNNEIFYYDYKDLFASAYNTVLNTTQTFNAQKVEIYGDQLDILWLPTDNDQVSLSVGYLHARNKEFVLPDGSADFNGLQLQYAPDWTASLGYHHDFELGSGRLRAQAMMRYESSFFSDFYHTPGGEQESYTKTDASLTYFAADDHWSVSLWAKNLENEAVLAATAGGSSSPLQPAGATTNLEQPRMYGLRATLNF